MSGLRRLDVAGLTLIAGACVTVESCSALVLSNVPGLPPGVNAAFFSWPVVQFETDLVALDPQPAAPCQWRRHREAS
jgi:hypothetical protein